MTYQTEFPEFCLDVVIPEGFVDCSWRNDSCPSWMYTFENGTVIRIRIDYSDLNLRDFRSLPRFRCEYWEDDQITEDPIAFCLVDVWPTVLEWIDFIKGLNVEIQ
ncbi:hypothetical protein [Kiloniella laminariae]|uniref:hypothetical protein n=1 Tax=Kiloniella laminariae TaxID=454162 RepID=UPI0012FADC49|nr:hypothetical protein [Kiloniella laminariae]